MELPYAALHQLCGRMLDLSTFFPIHQRARRPAVSAGCCRLGTSRPDRHLESGAPNALLAATRPERVQSMVWVEPNPRCAWAPDYPWGRKPEDLEAELLDIDLWGTLAYGRRMVKDAASRENEMPPDSTAARMAKASRNACTPDVARDLAKIWYETDVRGVLSAVQVPTLILAHPERKDVFDCARHVASLIPGAELREIPGRAWSEEGVRSMADEVRRFVGAERTPTELGTILSTVMFTDIVDSTQKQASLGDHRWRQLIERHHVVVREALQRWRGVEIDTAGDGFYANFDGPARAIRCALDACVASRSRDRDPCRSPHRRVRADQREGGRHRRFDRCTRRGAGGSFRGIGLADGEGPRGWLRPHVRGFRRARVEGRSRPLAPLLCGVGLRSPEAGWNGRLVTDRHLGRAR